MIDELKGKKVRSFRKEHDGCYNSFLLTFEDGTKLSWGYDDCEGHTHIEVAKK